MKLYALKLQFFLELSDGVDEKDTFVIAFSELPFGIITRKCIHLLRNRTCIKRSSGI